MSIENVVFDAELLLSISYQQMESFTKIHIYIRTDKIVSIRITIKIMHIHVN